MILYKFRSLSNLEYFLDIIHNEQFYCSPYSQLNDPLEGIFREIKLSSVIDASIGKKINEVITTDRHITLHDSFKYANDVKLCSLSAEEAFGDIRMWSHYANDHKGVAIEVDLPEYAVEKVTYLPDLFTIERFGGDEADSDIDRSMHDFILSHKTVHWEHEKEFRIIDKADHYRIPGGVKAIHLGFRCSDEHKDLLPKIIPNTIPIYTTELDRASLKIFSP